LKPALSFLRHNRPYNDSIRLFFTHIVNNLFSAPHNTVETLVDLHQRSPTTAMSTRRSGRATKAVKYTSASEGSDFEDKKKSMKKTSRTKKSEAAPPKKQSTKRAAAEPEAEADDATTAPSKPKRQKRDPETAVAEANEKAAAKQAKADKAAHKEAWKTWLKEHDAGGELLEEEPGKEESITQTDTLKKYGLKKEELGSLLHFEKKNPLYGGTMKLFLEENIRELGFRKLGMLEGVEGDEAVEKGEEIWTEEHKDDPEPETAKEKPAKPEKKEKPAKAEKAKKEKTPKNKWAEYITTHALTPDNTNDKLTEEPSDVINQTECKTKFSLTPQDLACLPYFPKKNAAYGNTMKLFKEGEVKLLAYRKTAVLAGVESDGKDDVGLLEKGKELFEQDD
jgi:hypothetical protein